MSRRNNFLDANRDAMEYNLRFVNNDMEQDVNRFFGNSNDRPDMQFNRNNSGNNYSGNGSGGIDRSQSGNYFQSGIAPPRESKTVTPKPDWNWQQRMPEPPPPPRNCFPQQNNNTGVWNRTNVNLTQHQNFSSQNINENRRIPQNCFVNEAREFYSSNERQQRKRPTEQQRYEGGQYNSRWSTPAILPKRMCPDQRNSYSNIVRRTASFYQSNNNFRGRNSTPAVPTINKNTSKPPMHKDSITTASNRKKPIEKPATAKNLNINAQKQPQTKTIQKSNQVVVKLQKPAVQNITKLKETETNETPLLFVIDKANKDGSITPANWKKVELALTVNMLKVLDENRGTPPVCRDAGWLNDQYKIIRCADERSADLYKKTIAKIGQIWPGANLQVVSRSEVPNSLTARANIRYPPFSKNSILEIIRLSNSNIPTHNWEIIKLEKTELNSFDAFIGINKESIDLLNAAKGEINYAFSCITLKGYDPNNAEELVSKTVANSKSAEPSDINMQSNKKSSKSIVQPELLSLKETTSIDKYKLLLMVVDQSTKNGSINPSNWKKVELALTANMLQVLNENPGPPPLCLDVGWLNNKVKLIRCADKRSAELYTKAIGKLGKIWPGADLKVKFRNQLMKPTARALIPFLPTNFDIILKTIKISNSNLPTHNWKIIKMEKTEGNTTTATIEINEESLGPLTECMGEINYGFSFITLKDFQGVPTTD